MSGRGFDQSNKQTVFIVQSLTGISDFKKQLSLSFHPKKMIVKSVCYRNDNKETDIKLLRLQNISEVICSFQDNSTLAPGYEFQLKSGISTCLYFQILDSAYLLDATLDGVLVVALEFSE